MKNKPKKKDPRLISLPPIGNCPVYDIAETEWEKFVDERISRALTKCTYEILSDDFERCLSRESARLAHSRITDMISACMNGAVHGLKHEIAHSVKESVLPFIMEQMDGMIKKRLSEMRKLRRTKRRE